MIGTVEYIPLEEPVELGIYYHSVFKNLEVIEIDSSQNRSKAILFTGYITYVNNDDLYELVISSFPINQKIFLKNLEFYYYESEYSRKNPKKDFVYKKDDLGVVGVNNKNLTEWSRIFKVEGKLNKSDYNEVFIRNIFQNVFEFIEKNGIFTLKERIY